MTASRRTYTLWWLVGGLLALVCLGIGLGSLTASAAPSGATGSDRPAAAPASKPPNGSPASLQAPAANPNSCPGNYQIVQVASGTVVSGTDLLVGSQCDDCSFGITLPFTYRYYGQAYFTATLTANGQIVFDRPADHSFTNACLPDVNSNYAIFPYWSDISMDSGLQQCIDIGCGVFTSTSGSGSNRIFNIEYRAISLFSYSPIYFEVRLYESSPRFDIIYSALDADSPNATIGAQRDTGSVFAQYQCPGSPGGLAPGNMLIFGYVDDCPTATPTETPTQTPTSTPGAGPILVGHVAWQGRPAEPDPADVLPVTLTMRYQDGSSINFSGLTTDASGFFTVPVGTLPNGAYTWRVKTAQVGAGQSDYNPGFLSTSGTLGLQGDPVTNVEMGLQLSGDSNNDNRVTAIDFIAVKLSFGQQPGQPNWDRRADYDGNNRITAVDFIQLKINFGHDGSPPIGPARR